MTTPEFTTDWFSTSIDGIQRTLRDYHRVSSILEIGSWEGRSACWFLDAFPGARITCVDTFKGSTEHAGLDIDGVKTRFLKNTAVFGDRVTVREGESSKMLYGLEPESFDVIYVDASHTEQDTLIDLVLAFGLLKKGGILLIDDYAQPESARLSFPGVRAAVDKFALVFSDRIRSVLCEYQVHFVKTR
jgi:predicted O-methyltransferase YrrM